VTVFSYHVLAGLVVCVHGEVVPSLSHHVLYYWEETVHDVHRAVAESLRGGEEEREGGRGGRGGCEKDGKARQGNRREGRAAEEEDKLGKNKKFSHSMTEKAKKFKTMHSEK
jgi:hypothetical protein